MEGSFIRERRRSMFCQYWEKICSFLTRNRSGFVFVVWVRWGRSHSIGFCSPRIIYVETLFASAFLSDPAKRMFAAAYGVITVLAKYARARGNCRSTRMQEIRMVERKKDFSQGRIIVFFCAMRRCNSCPPCWKKKNENEPIRKDRCCNSLARLAK